MRRCHLLRGADRQPQPHRCDVRAAFTHAGGNLGTSGSVSYMFERKGQIMVPKEVETGDKKHPMGPNGAAADEEEFEMAVIEAGGDDYEDADEEWIVYTQPSDLMAVKKALEEQGVQVKGAEMTMEPPRLLRLPPTTRRRLCAWSTVWRSLRTCRTCTTPWTSPRKSPRLWKKSKCAGNLANESASRVARGAFLWAECFWRRGGRGLGLLRERKNAADAFAEVQNRQVESCWRKPNIRVVISFEQMFDV